MQITNNIILDLNGTFSLLIGDRVAHNKNMSFIYSSLDYLWQKEKKRKNKYRTEVIKSLLWDWNLPIVRKWLKNTSTTVAMQLYNVQYNTLWHTTIKPPLKTAGHWRCRNTSLPSSQGENKTAKRTWLQWKHSISEQN